jgi:ABC-2 type transport system permease protein
MSNQSPGAPSAEPLASPDPAGAATLPAASRAGMAQQLLTLIRREVWEHKVLWRAPLLVAGLLILSAFLSSPGRMSFNFSNMPELHGGASSGGQSVGLADFLGSRLSGAFFEIGHCFLALIMFLTAAAVLSFYLTDCLYAERRDRSILFWKSLPVSDMATIGSKAIVGMLLAPLGIYLVSIVTDLLYSGIGRARVALGAPSFMLLPWDTVAWLKVQGLMLTTVLISILWYAPIGAYLLVVSAWARRNVFLWSLALPVLAPVAEKLSFDTDYIWRFLLSRTFVWSIPDIKSAIDRSMIPVGNHSIPSPSALFDTFPVAGVLTNIDLWAGVAVAVALVVIAARIRRYRDDS